MRSVRLGGETGAYFEQFIDQKNRINWALAGNYRAVILTVRQDYRKLSLKAAGYSREHEGIFFCRHEATVPLVAAALNIDLGHLTKLFKRAQRHSLIHVADWQAHQQIRTKDLVNVQVVVALDGGEPH